MSLVPPLALLLRMSRGSLVPPVSPVSPGPIRHRGRFVVETLVLVLGCWWVAHGNRALLFPLPPRTQCSVSLHEVH